MSKPIIRTLDIETAPDLGHVWGWWNNNLSPNQVVEDCYIIAFAYKDLDGDWIHYHDLRDNTKKQLVKKMVKAVDEADIIIGHNAGRFDLPWINGQAAKYGIKPPQPPILIDTYKAGKGAFRLPSYKLEYMARIFGCAPKSAHKSFPGHELWMETVVKNNPEAWDEMEQYNCQDVETNEELYLIIRPWIKGHPNMGLFLESEEPVCPKCGSNHIHSRGYSHTGVSKFRKFQCQDCGGWGRERVSVLSKEVKKALTTNAR